MNKLSNYDRLLAIKYSNLPVCVNPSAYKVFGLSDLDDKWLMNTTYVEDAIKESV